MSRVRKLFTLVLPSMLIGGLVFGSAPGFAHDGRDNVIADAGDTTASSTTFAFTTERSARRAPRPRVAQGPTPPRPPKPPRAPAPPTPPTPPTPGITISINGNKIDLSGIEGMIRGQLDGAREAIRNNPNIPPQVRDKILARLDKVRASVDKRLAKIKNKGVDELGEELEQLGEDIEQAMEGLDEELEQLGDKLGKDIAKKLSKKKFNFDFKQKHKHKHDDHEDEEEDEDDENDPDFSDAIPMTPDLQDTDSDDMRDALDDLRGMAIKPDQKDKIAKLRAESDAKVGAARKQLDELSKKLEVALGDPRTNDADIRRYVDAISQQEAEIRKARILAWVNARRILDDAQRKRIEAAAAKKRSK